MTQVRVTSDRDEDREMGSEEAIRSWKLGIGGWSEEVEVGPCEIEERCWERETADGKRGLRDQHWIMDHTTSMLLIKIKQLSRSTSTKTCAASTSTGHAGSLFRHSVHFSSLH